MDAVHDMSLASLRVAQWVVVRYCLKFGSMLCCFAVLSEFLSREVLGGAFDIFLTVQ